MLTLFHILSFSHSAKSTVLPSTSNSSYWLFVH